MTAAPSMAERIARAGGAARAALARKGFVLHMFAGFVLDCEESCCRECPPKLYPTLEAAFAYLDRFGDGADVFTVYHATVVPHGEEGRPDYIFGAPVYARKEEPTS